MSESTITRVIAELCYDSAAAAPAGGTRGFASRRRMLLFQWGPLSVNLMVQEGKYELCLMHGHVTRNGNGEPVPGAEAVAGVKKGKTDEYGQFSLTVQDAWDPRQLLVRTDETEIVCPLPGAAA